MSQTIRRGLALLEGKLVDQPWFGLVAAVVLVFGLGLAPIGAFGLLGALIGGNIAIWVVMVVLVAIPFPLLAAGRTDTVC